MGIRELKYFLQIVKDQSFTKAARNLYLSQPALSKCIKKLEANMGVPLLKNNGNVIQPTEYGQILFTQATKLVSEFDKLKVAVQSAAPYNSETISVGITPMIGTLFMVPIITEFCNLHPEIELKIYEDGSNVIREKIAKDELDLGVCISASNQYDPNEIPILHGEMVAIFHSGHPLAQKASVRFEELKTERFNLYSTASALKEQIVERCAWAGFVPIANLYSSKVHFLMEMTANGRGILLLPKPYANKFLWPDLRAVPFNPIFPWECIAVSKKCPTRAAQILFEHVLHSFEPIAKQHGILSEKR